MNRPQPHEHSAYFARYTSLVPDGDILELLREQLEPVLVRLGQLSAAQLEHRYAPDKWNTLQIVRHLCDTERVFTFRATHIARRDPNPLPGFDQDWWLNHAPHSSLPALLEEWRSLRTSAVHLFSSLSAEDWTHCGTASDSPLSPRACAYIIVGHLIHHQNSLQKQYGIEL